MKTSVISILEGVETDTAASSNAIHTEDIVSGSMETAEAANGFELRATEQIVSPFLFGSNMEHTRSDIYNGLSAQMLKNRKFVGKPSAASGHAVGWFPIGEKTFFAFSAPYTRHMEGHYHMHRLHECNAQRVMNFHDGTNAGIGQHEIYISKNTSYDFAVVVKSDKTITLDVKLTSRDGDKVYVQKEIIVSGTDWTRYSECLIPDTADPDADLCITFKEAASVDIGAVSLMPSDNYRGMRKDVIALLKEMGIKLLRWPGGNFAGEYNWIDGLMPVDMRAPFQSYLWLETQPHSLGYDFHEINTDDFVALCREIGAEPFLTLNPAWNTPEESAMWVEYCNGDLSTAYGKLRAERGYEEPYNVQFWSLGNEFGYGHMEGENTPQGYQLIARQHGDAMLACCDTISFCSSGPYPNKDWADHAAIPLSVLSPLVSLHYYAPERDFTDIEKDYLNCISSVNTARRLVHTLRSQLNDSLRISFDEWNTWYAWYRPSCVTDGIFAGLMLHMIIEEAEKSGIGVACQFEAVNEGAIIVTPTSASLTATGQAYAMMKEHINGMIYHSSSEQLATCKDGIMTVSVVNTSFDAEKTMEIPCSGNVISAKIYDGKDLLPHAKFEIIDAEAEIGEKGIILTIPAHSMALVKLHM